MSIRSARNLLAALVIASFPAPVFAGAVISEIMYDLPGSDQGREWIEVQNIGDLPLDMTGWRFAEAGVNHKLAPKGSSILPPRAFAVIADDAGAFRADWPLFSGILFESSFSLSNTGETIGLKDASSTPIASVAFASGLAAAGDGNSLNAEGGAWKALAPSPGASASLSAVVPLPATAVNPAPKTSNLLKPVAVRSTSGSKNPLPGAPRPAAAVAAAAESVPAGDTPGPFAILPWIGGLVLISAAGIAAVLIGRRRKNRSGYEITEEES